MGLNYLHRESEFQVIWFHDSFGVIEELVNAIDRRSYFIFSFSWFSSEERLSRIFSAFQKSLAAAEPTRLASDRILFLMNSAEEMQTAARLSAPFRTALVNNACFLDPNLYEVLLGRKKIFDAVCNSKPLAFKRHRLTNK